MKKKKSKRIKCTYLYKLVPICIEFDKPLKKGNSFKVNYTYNPDFDKV